MESADSQFESPFETPGARQLSAWTLRLAADPVFGVLLVADPHLFAMFYAACAAAVPPPDELLPEASPSSAEAGEKLLATLKDLQRQFGNQTSGQFAGLYLDGIAMHAEVAKDFEAFTRHAVQWQREADNLVSRYVTAQEQNVDMLAELLELDSVETDLLTFQLTRHTPGFAQLFEILLRAGEAAATVLGRLFGVSGLAVQSALSDEGVLVRSGLLSAELRPLRIDPVSAHLRAVLSEHSDTEEEFFERFVAPLEVKASTASLARLEDRDRDILMRLLKLPNPDSHSVNALVYGPKAVDKRDMLARLLQAEGLAGYAITTKNVPASDLPAWVFIAQRYLENTAPDAVLLVDRAEQALTARSTMSIMSLFGMVEGEGPADDDGRSSDDGLTASRIRCVWLTDRANALSERNLGRFLFHCEARPGSRADRRERITAVISEFGLSQDLEHHLAKYSLLGESQVRQAATLARLLSESPDERDPVIRRAVLQAQKVLGRDRTEELRDSVTQYSLDNLNVAGRFKPEQILKALRQRPQGQILMHGLPGAGKTQLAEYLAVELDLPIIMKSASDLLSKWLGESEQNIAGMFAEAEAEGALLFLDEADSFLRDRAMARAEWSVTQVNELLQRMERHPGIFIAATNLMQDIDAAAMRRFTWKLEFLPLKPEQAWHMFCTEAGIDPDGNAEELEVLAAQLGAIRNLTPGDFATVKRQANMLGEQLSPEDWLGQLAAEAKAKMAGLERNKLGFS